MRMRKWSMRFPIGATCLLALAAVASGPVLCAETEDVFDHSRFGEVLASFVDERGLVDYAGLKRQRSGLDSYLGELGKLPDQRYQAWPDSEKIAFWINAYNAFTLKAIVDHYPIRSSFLKSFYYPKNSIRQIDGVWDKLKFRVKGEDLTLDHMEHEILRKQFSEPRIHMALVCAALSCPPLRDQPYVGAQLEEQLEDQSKRFLSRPENFSIDRSGRTPAVELSSIFEWFGADFVPRYGAGGRFPDSSAEVRAVLNFAWPHLSPGDREALAKGKPTVSYTSYDWTLNAQSSSN